MVFPYLLPGPHEGHETYMILYKIKSALFSFQASRVEVVLFIKMGSCGRPGELWGWFMPEDDVAALEKMNLNYLEYPNTDSIDSCFINGCDPQKRVLQ